MENTQETPNANSLRIQLDNIRSLASQGSQVLNHLENIIHEQQRKIKQLESSCNMNQDNFYKMLAIIDSLMDDIIDSALSDQTIPISIGEYTDRVYMYNVVDTSNMVMDADRLKQKLEEIGIHFS